MQKGSAVAGALLTDEVLDSSDHILTKGVHGGFKGAQQFFTPEPVAELAAYVTSSGSGRVEVPVLDPTAGDGSFLKPVGPTFSFGVEIDKDQIKNAEGSYIPIQGDLQKVAPLMYRVCPEFPAIWANPPFGLKDWADETINDGRPVGSARLTFIWSMRMLAEDGQIVFICGKDQFHREIAPLPEAKGIYYVVEVDDLFEGTTHPSAIAFGVHPELRKHYRLDETQGFETKAVPMEMLDLVGPKVLEARNVATHNGYNSVAHRTWGGGHLWKDAFEAIQKEYDRRKAVAEGEKTKREFDIELVGGKMLSVQPSAFAQLALAKRDLLRSLKMLHGKTIDWFASYERDWVAVEEAMASGVITVQPKVIQEVEAILIDSRRTVCPLYPIKEVQRLGYLTDLSTIKCKKSDPERGFVAGEMYGIEARSATITEKIERPEVAKRGKNAGETVIRTFERQRKVLRITVAGQWRFTDSDQDQADIRYFLDHFEVPDPGDVGTRYPAEVEENRKLLNQIAEDTVIPCSEAYAEKHPEKPAITPRKFQIEDLARLIVKVSGLISWEQGLGKTLGAVLYTLAAWRRGAQKCALYIVPQDLIPQWQAEWERFTGGKLELIKTHGQAREVAKKLRLGGEGAYITYYEALSVNGTSRSEMLPEIIVEQKTEVVKIKGTGRWGPAQLATKSSSEEGVIVWKGVNKSPHTDDDGRTIFVDAQGNVVQSKAWVPKDWDIEDKGHALKQDYGQYIPEQWEEKLKNITSAHICPACHADRKSGWNGKFCRATNNLGEECGYSHYLHRVKPMGSILSTAFRKGVIVVDEGTMIQGDYSARSTVIRGLRARHKLLMTGTPVKNYIPQAFWLLWWALGNQSKRFPYGYGGKSDFENNHAVIEWLVMGGKKQARKVLPEVTNLSQLWRLLASSIIRRRKEETGEVLVKRTMYPITVPLGEAQREQMEKWRKDFHLFFEEKYPDSDVVKAGAAEMMAPMLGLRMKLDYAATVPCGDPDYEWTGVEGVSNWTPANLRTLEVVMTLAKQGRKVLVGSQWKESCNWLTEKLVEKGVNARSLLDANGNTIPPKNRAAVVGEFQSGKVDVLVATIQSIRYGHNLDTGNAAVIHGLPDDYESYDQYIARIHRLTSINPVDVYVIIPGSETNKDRGATITRLKWDTLRQKGDAANLALDGRLIEADELEIDESEVLKTLMEKGVPVNGDEVPEAEVERLWGEIPQFEAYEPDPSLLRPTLDIVEDFGDDEEPVDVLGTLADSVEPDAVEKILAVLQHPEPIGPELPSWDEIAAAHTVCWFIKTGAALEPQPVGDLEIEGEEAGVAPGEVQDAAPVAVEPEGAAPEPTEEEAPEEDFPLGQLALLPAEPEPEPEPEPVAAVNPQEIVEAIKGLKELLDLGALTEEEFNEAKQDTLARLKVAA
jgi:hypothetical protein